MEPLPISKTHLPRRLTKSKFSPPPVIRHRCKLGEHGRIPRDQRHCTVACSYWLSTGVGKLKLHLAIEHSKQTLLGG